MIALSALMIGAGVFVLFSGLLYAIGSLGEKPGANMSEEIIYALGIASVAGVWIVSWFVVRSLST